jgi:phosphohistidine phosphatase
MHPALNRIQTMPKHLHLLRHADAAQKEARQDDKSREVTQAGIKDSLHMGAWFVEQNIHFDLLVTSSARRAEQTTQLIAESMKLDQPRILEEDVLYEASVRQLLDYVNTIEDGYDNVLVTGHNPSISYLAEYLTKAHIGDMAPGSVAIIRFDFNNWKSVGENTGQLLHYVAPEQIAKF